jgi:predicted nucleic acid-binding protein
MNAIIDTNIIIDAITAREPHIEERLSSERFVNANTYQGWVAKSFAHAIKELSEKVNTDVTNEQNKKTPIALHQMRKCFKLGIRGCPLNPIEKKIKSLLQCHEMFLVVQ